MSDHSHLIFKNRYLSWAVGCIFAIVFLAILFTPAKWASSGDITVPVKFLVFDLESTTPIADARIRLFRGTPWFDDGFLEEFKRNFTDNVELNRLNINSGVTDASGQAGIDYKFRTGASHLQPNPSAHTSWVWAVIEADGYGVTTVQVRSDFTSVSQLHRDQDIRIAVGLRKDSS